MELGGWKSYEMVLRYAHLAPDYLSHAAARIKRMLDIVEPNFTFCWGDNSREVGAAVGEKRPEAPWIVS